jgi:predicted signal transduction protein with EAL and GGDEF domain
VAKGPFHGLRPPCRDGTIAASRARAGRSGGEAGNGAGTAADSADLRELLKRADIALYESKGGGLARVVAYSDDIGSTYTAHVEELADYRQAIPHGEIVPYRRTQVDALTGEIVGCEVLARWRHPRNGILVPDTLLTLADELGLIADLDREILDRAIAAHARLAEAGVSRRSL